MKVSTLIVFAVSFLTLNLSLRAQPKLYAGGGYSQYIRVLNPTTLDSIGFIENVGGYRMAYCAPKRKLYSTSGSNFVSVIDAVADTLIRAIFPQNDSISVSELEAITISPDGSRIYVMDEQGDNGLFVINTETDLVVRATKSIPTYEPENMVISQNGQSLFVVDNTDLIRIAASTLTETGRTFLGGDAHGVAISKNGSALFAEANVGVVKINSTTLARIDTFAGANGYFLHVNEAETHILGVEENQRLDVMNQATGTIQSVSWLQGSARGVTTYQNDNFYYVATSAGVFKISSSPLAVVDSSRNWSFQSILIANVEFVGNQEPIHSTSSVRAFPNPVDDQVHILDEGNQVRAISLYDAKGKVHYRTLLDTSKTINLERTLPEGLYFMVFEGIDQMIVEREKVMIRR